MQKLEMHLAHQVSMVSGLLNQLKLMVRILWLTLLIKLTHDYYGLNLLEMV